MKQPDHEKWYGIAGENALAIEIRQKLLGEPLVQHDIDVVRSKENLRLHDDALAALDQVERVRLVPNVLELQQPQPELLLHLRMRVEQRHQTALQLREFHQIRKQRVLVQRRRFLLQGVEDLLLEVAVRDEALEPEQVVGLRAAELVQAQVQQGLQLQQSQSVWLVQHCLATLNVDAHGILQKAAERGGTRAVDVEKRGGHLREVVALVDFHLLDSEEEVVVAVGDLDERVQRDVVQLRFEEALLLLLVLLDPQVQDLLLLVRAAPEDQQVVDRSEAKRVGLVR